MWSKDVRDSAETYGILAVSGERQMTQEQKTHTTGRIRIGGVGENNHQIEGDTMVTCQRVRAQVGYENCENLEFGPSACRQLDVIVD